MISQIQNHMEIQYTIQQHVTQKVKHWVNSNSILVFWNDYVKETIWSWIWILGHLHTIYNAIKEIKKEKSF
jgi:hypothetical protein